MDVCGAWPAEPLPLTPSPPREGEPAAGGVARGRPSCTGVCLLFPLSPWERGLGGEVAPCRYPLTLPMVRPALKKRWRYRKSAISGTLTSTDEAAK